MPTSLHIPKPLIEAVDRRARALRISRNKFILRAIERELEHGSEWSPGFFSELADVEPGDAEAVDAMRSAIRAARTRKAPRRL